LTTEREGFVVYDIGNRSERGIDERIAATDAQQRFILHGNLWRARGD